MRRSSKSFREQALPNQALQRTAATELVCQGVEFRWLPRPLSLGVRHGEYNSVEDALRELEDFLPGANYLVDFQIIRLPFVVGWTPQQYIGAAVGPKPPIVRIVEVGLPNMLAEVGQYLRYDRDQYSHLAHPPQRTMRFAELAADVQAGLECLAANSESMFRFWRVDPIEWQFSFLFVGPGGAVVFNGWGSD